MRFPNFILKSIIRNILLYLNQFSNSDVMWLDFSKTCIIIKNTFLKWLKRIHIIEPKSMWLRLLVVVVVVAVVVMQLCMCFCVHELRIRHCTCTFFCVPLCVLVLATEGYL